MNVKRWTAQRKAIKSLIEGNHEHPAVDDIYANAKELIPNVSKKTVYTALEALKSEGIIQEVRVTGVRRYEPVEGDHQHFICTVCGKIIDIKDDSLTSHTMKISRGLKGIEVLQTTTTFYGKCNSCLGGK